MRLALEIASSVRQGQILAADIVEACLGRLAETSRTYCAVTRTLSERAREEAARVDAIIAVGGDPGPLAGVPYGVKDLFDVAGLPTTAGSAIYADAPPARADAEAIVRLRAAGAILIATLNMDEFAYGFSTINTRHGTTCNPHDPERLAGGSSGGSAAAVAGGLLPFSLGSDTNGSVRVPASLTGVYGLKPTHHGLPMRGVFPFAESFDDIGPFSVSVADLRCLWEVLSGTSLSDDKSQEFRVAQLGGRFRDNADPDQLLAMGDIAKGAATVKLSDIAAARSAAFLMTAYEGGTLHRDALSRDAMAFDPATRDRLIAGALLPPALYEEAQAFRRHFKAKVDDLIADYDVLLAPATPCVAPLITDPQIMIDGAMRPARADLGIHTQPISFLGLPALSVPLRRSGRLPLGLQLIGKRGSEATLFAYAAILEAQGVTGVSSPVESYQGELV